MAIAERPVHTSVNLSPRVHRALVVKLAREAKTMSDFFREAAESYVGAKPK